MPLSLGKEGCSIPTAVHNPAPSGHHKLENHPKILSVAHNTYHNHTASGFAPFTQKVVAMKPPVDGRNDSDQVTNAHTDVRRHSSMPLKDHCWDTLL